jgi:hypothetical protein
VNSTAFFPSNITKSCKLLPIPRKIKFPLNPRQIGYLQINFKEAKEWEIIVWGDGGSGLHQNPDLDSRFWARIRPAAVQVSMASVCTSGRKKGAGRGKGSCMGFCTPPCHARRGGAAAGGMARGPLQQVSRWMTATVAVCICCAREFGTMKWVSFENKKQLGLILNYF